MQINTKFDPKDIVWYLNKNVPTQTEVKSVNIKIENLSRLNIIIKYDLLRERTPIHENSIFETQKDLYASMVWFMNNVLIMERLEIITYTVEDFIEKSLDKNIPWLEITKYLKTNYKI